MSILLKALGVVSIATVLILVLKQKNGEISFLISIAAVCTVGVYVVLSLKTPLEQLKKHLSEQNIDLGYFKTALKALVIAYISETVADTCRDFGQTAMAHKAELAGKCVIFVITVPVFIDILNVALSFLKL